MEYLGLVMLLAALPYTASECLRIGQENHAVTSLLDIWYQLRNSTEAIHSFCNADIPEVYFSEENFTAQQLTFTNLNSSYFKLDISNTFPFLQNLQILHNPLTTVNLRCTRSSSSLRKLTVAYTQLESLESSSFCNYSALTRLNLSHNIIKHVDTKFLLNFQSLEILDLSHNHIDYIHPQLFRNLTQLRELRLDHNHLEGIHQGVFDDLPSLQQIFMAANMWECSCGVQWMLEKMQFIKDFNDIKCHLPGHLRNNSLAELDVNLLKCDSPVLHGITESHSVKYLHSTILRCNASGYPAPSIYWLTPRGHVLTYDDHPSHPHWIDPDIDEFYISHSHAGMPTAYRSQVDVQQDGSLLIRQFRRYFSGQFRCLAQNPAGLVGANVTILVTTSLKTEVLRSLVVAGLAAAAFLTFSITFALVRLAITNCRKKSEDSDVEEKEKIDVARYSPSYDFSNYNDDDTDDEFDSGGKTSPFTLSIDSPTIPSPDALERGDERLEVAHTLEDVRARLRTGVERSRERLRTRAIHVRENVRSMKDQSSARLRTVKQTSTQKLHTIKENSSQKLHTIKESSTLKIQQIKDSSSEKFLQLKETSSNLTTKVRTGVVLGVESVKYHVKSVKEFCGTGDIGQTISAVSIATDVDTQARTEVVRSITFV